MDLTKAVAYRGANLNTATATVGKPGIVGCILERADVRAIEYIGESEKRRVADGMDTIEPYMGLHRFVLSGTVYGQTRGATYDALQALKEAFNPVKALLQSPSTKGFLPFTFSNTIARSVNCRPMGLKYSYDATRAGSNAKIAGQEDAVGLGIRWSAELLVNTVALLSCGEWPPPPPDFTPIYPIPGDTTPGGGLLCSVNGWTVPLQTGDASGIMHASSFMGGSGRYVGDSFVDFNQYVYVYRGSTYHVNTYDVIHGPNAAPIFIQLNNASVYQVDLGDDEPGFAGFGHPVPGLTHAEGTWVVGGDYATDPTPVHTRAVLVELPWTGHNHDDSEHYTVLTYISGPDPRFVGLPVCPDPRWHP